MSRRLRPWLGFVAMLAASATGCVYARMVRYNMPSLSAASVFDARGIDASPTPSALATRATERAIHETSSRSASYRSFDALLEANETRAFLVLQHDTIVYERYFGGVTATTELPAFSVSKTFAALLIGCAIDDRILPSVDTSIASLVPELAKKDRYGEVTLDHLLRMTSGIDFDEESTAAAVLYYATDLHGRIYGYDVVATPGERYLYGSVNIELLWDALHRGLKGETVSHYFERRVWWPIGAEHAASWSLDSLASGMEKFFGGFNATARDQARLGLLFSHGGLSRGKSIISRTWVDESITPDPVPGFVHTTDGIVRRGKYQWFLTVDGTGYFAKGYNGQYIFVYPDKDMVFVRFGEGYGDVDWPVLFGAIANDNESGAETAH